MSCIENTHKMKLCCAVNLHFTIQPDLEYQFKSLKSVSQNQRKCRYDSFALSLRYVSLLAPYWRSEEKLRGHDTHTEPLSDNGLFIERTFASPNVAAFIFPFIFAETATTSISNQAHSRNHTSLASHHKSVIYIVLSKMFVCIESLYCNNN